MSLGPVEGRLVWIVVTFEDGTELGEREVWIDSEKADGEIRDVIQSQRGVPISIVRKKYACKQSKYIYI